MDSGGYDANFVDEPLGYFKCIVCHMVLRDPVLFVECGHRVCKICFNQMKGHAADTNIPLLCPHDRIPIDSDKVFDDKGISRTILDFRVKCERVSSGCGWIGELRDLATHLSGKCGYGGELAKRVDACEEKLRQKDVEIDLLRQTVGRMDDQITHLQRQLETLMSNHPSASQRRPHRHPTRVSSLSNSSRAIRSVLFDFSGISENELCVSKGEKVVLVGVDDGSGWSRVARGNDDGYIPTSYLQLPGLEGGIRDSGGSGESAV